LAFFTVELLPLPAFLPRSSDFFGAWGWSAGVGVDDGVSLAVGVLVDAGDPSALSPLGADGRLEVGVAEGWEASVGRVFAAARGGRRALVATG